MKFLATTIGKLVAGLVIVLLIVGFLYVRSCTQASQRAAQSRVDQSQGAAFQNSATDALNTAGGVAANQSASEDLTRTNERDIRNAHGADQNVDPAVRDAGFTSLCKRASFRNSPSGRLRCTPAGDVAPAR